jgi:hypothetical protein
VRELISKLVAGGLSAAVILLWWPRFFPADTAATWLIRGVIWTLSFELLVHALLPLERALWDTRPVKKVRATAGDRLGAPRHSMRGQAGVACFALTIPLALLALAPSPPAKSSPAASVRHVTEVKRIVKVERKQVRVPKVVPVEAAPAPAPPVLSERPRVVRPVTPVKQRRDPERTPANGEGSSPSSPTKAPEAADEQPVDAPRVVRRAATA